MNQHPAAKAWRVTIEDANGNPVAFGGPDREITGLPFRVKTGFAGGNVGDLLLAIRVFNLTTSSPTPEGATVWLNETQATTLEAAPLAANIEPAGLSGLTSAQLAAMTLEVGGPATVITITPNIVTGAMTAGDVLFDFTELQNAVRDAGGQALIQSITVIDKGDLQAAALDLYLSGAAVALGTSNAAPSITDANAAGVDHLGQIGVADWKDLGGVRVATLKGVGVLGQAAATSLWIGAVTQGTANNANADIVVRVALVMF